MGYTNDFNQPTPPYIQDLYLWLEEGQSTYGEEKRWKQINLVITL
jgi:hypothetical protein